MPRDTDRPEASLAVELQRHRNVLQDDVLVKDNCERERGLRAIEAFAKLPSGIEPDQGCLDALARAAASPEAHVGCVGADLLYKLSLDFEVARQTIRLLLRDGNEDARFWAISAATMYRQVSNPFVVEILCLGLADRNAKVSMHAAFQGMRLGIKDLLLAMSELSEQLTDPDDRESCEACVGLLRDGFLVQLLSGGECHLSVRLDNGDLIGWMGKEADVSSKGVAGFAKQIAQQYLADEAQREADRRRSIAGGTQ